VFVALATNTTLVTPSFLELQPFTYFVIFFVWGSTQVPLGSLLVATRIAIDVVFHDLWADQWQGILGILVFIAYVFDGRRM
jgi:hypothetical protein